MVWTRLIMMYRNSLSSTVQMVCYSFSELFKCISSINQARTHQRAWGSVRSLSSTCHSSSTRSQLMNRSLSLSSPMELPVRWSFYTLAHIPDICDIANGEDLVWCWVPLDRFCIQFMQIGTDEEAVRALQVLDDELSDRYKIRVGILFMVSLTCFTHQLSRTSCLTLILRPCSTWITCSRSSSEVSTKNVPLWWLAPPEYETPSWLSGKYAWYCKP